MRNNDRDLKHFVEMEERSHPAIRTCFNPFFARGGRGGDDELLFLQDFIVGIFERSVNVDDVRFDRNNTVFCLVFRISHFSIGKD